MTDSEFCKLDSQFYGEKVDNIKQIAKRTFDGVELKEYIEHFIKLTAAKTVWHFDCWDRKGSMETKQITALNEENATIIFKYHFPDLGFDPPY